MLPENFKFLLHVSGYLKHVLLAGRFCTIYQCAEEELSILSY